MLTKDGLYGIVRHPSYTGVYFGCAGTVICHLDGASWRLFTSVIGHTSAVLLAVYWLLWVLWGGIGIFRRSDIEDKALAQKFGTKWQGYASRVPYKFIPGLI